MAWHLWVAVALAAAGIWAAWLRVGAGRKAAAMAAWPTTIGTVLGHGIDETTSVDADGDRDTSYETTIRYAYQALGREWTGSRVSLAGNSFPSRRKAQAWLDERPVGSTVTVHYDPTRPDEAVLRIDASNDWWVPLFFFALAAAVGLGLFGGG